MLSSPVPSRGRGRSERRQTPVALGAPAAAPANSLLPSQDCCDYRHLRVPKQGLGQGRQRTTKEKRRKLCCRWCAAAASRGRGRWPSKVGGRGRGRRGRRRQLWFRLLGGGRHVAPESWSRRSRRRLERSTELPHIRRRCRLPLRCWKVLRPRLC